MEYLIKTYTNENEMVLDFTMGSGTTGIAAKAEGFGFVGIEREAEYMEIAKARIEKCKKKLFNWKEHYELQRMVKLGWRHGAA